MELGYCCINTSIPNISTNRGMQKARFLRDQENGLKECGELALQNIYDLITIIEWNELHNIKLFRMSSDMFPWMSHYKLQDLPNFFSIKNALFMAGALANKQGHRLTFHPSHFCVLASDNQEVVKKSIKELNQHGEIMDLMNLSQTYFNPINIHINTTKGGKSNSAKRFCDNFKLLNRSVQKRLTIENDDFANQYSVSDLFTYIYLDIKIPITFDFFHYQYGPPDLELKSALELALMTWPKEIKPLTHISSSRQKEQNDSLIRYTAHADYIYEKIETFGFDFDCDLEAKAKEKALLYYICHFIDKKDELV